MLRTLRAGLAALLLTTAAAPALADQQTFTIYDRAQPATWSKVDANFADLYAQVGGTKLCVVANFEFSPSRRWACIASMVQDLASRTNSTVSVPVYTYEPADYSRAAVLNSAFTALYLAAATPVVFASLDLSNFSTAAIPVLF